MRKTRRGLLSWARGVSVVCAVILAMLALPGPARAEDEPVVAAAPPSAAAAQAKKLFSEGSALYLKGHYPEALDALRSSYALVPSPNSQLVIARCLRDLGRLVEAQAMFAAAEVEARRRAAEGALKYEQTADSAASEGAAVRSGLGTVRIRIEGVEAGTKLEVDGVPVEVSNQEVFMVWHTPGEVAVSVHSTSGLEQKQAATVRAGTEITMEFGPPRAAPPVEPPPVSPEAVSPLANATEPGVLARPSGPLEPTWPKAAAFGSGALTLAGAGMFTGFSIASRQTFVNLRKYCGSAGCLPTDRTAVNQADAGKTQQTIAYASLAVGVLAAVATVTFVAVTLSHPAPDRRLSGQWRVVVGATTLGVAVEFQ